MRPISEAFRKKLYEDDYRNFVRTVYITLSDGEDLILTNENLWNYGIAIDEAISPDNVFAIGSAIINQCTITIENISGRFNSKSFENAHVIPYVGFEVDDGQGGSVMEVVKLGEYDVHEAKHDLSCITLTCYDPMVKFEKTIDASTLDYSSGVTLDQIVADACTICGVKLITTSLPHGDYTVFSKPDGGTTTFRELISWTGQICGVNARIRYTTDADFAVGGDFYGQTRFAYGLEFIQFSKTALSNLRNNTEPIPAHHEFTSTFGAPQLSLEDVRITQVAVSEKVKDADGNDTVARYVKGISGYTISIEDNALVQGGQAEAIATWLKNDLQDILFRKASFSTLSDPSVQPGDIAKLYDRKGNAYVIIISGNKFHPGQQQVIRSSATEPERTSVNRSSQEVKNYIGALKAVAEERKQRADGDTTVLNTVAGKYASFEYLRTDYLNTQAVESKFAAFDKAIIGEVDARLVNTYKLKADTIEGINGSFETIDAAFAKVAQVVGGVASFDDLTTIKLTSTSATVDETFINTLVASVAVINSLVAGNIDTDEVRIASGDETMVLDGSFLQFKDIQGNTRIQIGKDSNNIYSFTIYGADGNALWYNDGITEKGIPGGTISNNMVKTKSPTYNGLEADKLDISSLRGAIEDDGGLSASSIKFNEGEQTLEQFYSNISSITTINQTANEAKNSAENTAKQVDSLKEIVSGIDTLEGITLTLSNDAHVVHTLSDGSNGDYTEANSRVTVLLGTTDVTADSVISYKASPSVAGTYNANTHTFQVTNLTDDNGWVDFSVAYGAQDHYLLVPLNGEDFRLTTRSGNPFVIPAKAVHLSKRFSISKSPDGKVGTSYNISSSALVLARNSEGTLTPSTIAFTAHVNDGSGSADYLGRFRIEESNDGIVYEVKYTSPETGEYGKVYTPVMEDVKIIRATLLDASGQMLDMASVMVIADTDELAGKITQAQQGIQTLTDKYGEVTSGINGLKTELGEAKTTLYGVVDNNLLYQTPFTWSDDKQTANFRAVVYKSGQDATAEFPDRWFSWWLRTEDGEEKMQDGKTFSVSKSQLGFGGTVVGRFNTYETKNLVTRNGNPLTTRSGAYLQIYAE